MKLSVVMPVYNTKKVFLCESIESILNQTYYDFEFIIINDGSTDDNVENVILSYKDNRIKYIKQENSGIVKSLNNGFTLAKGEYIARMDADDIAMPNRFEKQIEFLDTHNNISICGSNIEIFRQNSSKIRKYPENPKILELLKECCICHPSVMLRKKDFEKYALEYTNEYLCEDYDLWTRAIKFLNFYNIQEPLLRYRIHENNLSLSSPIFKQDVIRVKENLLDYITSNENLKFKLQKKYIKKNSFWRNIFSLSNDTNNKVLTIFYLKILLWKL